MTAIATLADLIRHVESGNNRYAMRFERTFIAGYRVAGRVSEVNLCSVDTARMIASTSWGLFQIMGANLYDACELNVSVGAYMNDEALQERCFNLFCRKRGIEFTLDEVLMDEKLRHEFARHYNGPAAIEAYSARMLSIYRDVSSK